MIVYPSGLSGGNQTVQAIGTAIGGSIAAAGGVVSGTIIGLPAGAVLAAVGGLVALGSQLAGALGVGEGCGPTCVQATNVVNNAEPTFRMNLDAYEAGTIDQPTAQQNYNQMWLAVQQSCGAIPGDAGKNCVSDRAEGSCKWKQTAAPKYPGQPNMGECWNWYNAYYTPLTLPSLNPVSSNVGSIVNSLASSPIALIGGALLIVGLMAGDK